MSAPTSQALAVSVERLTKRYGVHAAVDGISFEVKRGEVVGFLGPNGAGKSTTLKILCGFLGATSGSARIEGHDVSLDRDAARRATGYMPEAVPLYGEMRVREYLTFRAELKGVSRRNRVAWVGDAMERARIVDVADTVIEALSKGYRQRVGLADALVARPPLLVLDEPTAGMDPNQIREVRDVIKGLGSSGGGSQTVLLSTHILSEVEASCARVIVIDRGKLVAEGTPQELAQLRRPPHIAICARGDEATIRRALAPVAHVTLSKVESAWAGGVPDEPLLFLTCDVDRGHELGGVAEEIVAALVGARVGVRTVTGGKASLEEVFTSLTSDAVHSDDAEKQADSSPKGSAS